MTFFAKHLHSRLRIFRGNELENWSRFMFDLFVIFYVEVFCLGLFGG
jgi:hypothetical protein